MRPKTVRGVFRRTLNEPGLLGFSEQTVFDFTAGIIAVIDVKRFCHVAIGEDDHGIDIGIIGFEGIGQDDNRIDWTWRE